MRPAELEQLKKIAAEDGRYHLDAYLFLLEALEFCLSRLGQRRHVSGQELSLAARDLARERFGMLALPVFRHWGLKGTGDFGEIVYALIRHGQMKKADGDSLSDFADVFDFQAAFEQELPIPLPD